MNTPENKGQKNYLFNVDLLIESPSNAKALAALLEILNQPPFTDFNIQSGIEFGHLIDQVKQEPRDKKTINVPQKLKSKQPAIPADMKPELSPAAAAKPVPHIPSSVLERIYGYIAGNQLIRLNVNKERGVKLSVPCRLINFDIPSQIMTVYHVDEKKVYTFTLNEIDDFIE